jgi:hypothetical protein
MKFVKILGAMIGNIDEDNVKLIHDSNDAKRFQTSTLG